MLTSKQAQCRDFIEAYIARTGTGPAYDEIATALGLKSKSSVNRLCTALEERGFIRRIKGRTRAIEILRCADGTPVRRAPPAPNDRAGLQARLDMLEAETDEIIAKLDALDAAEVEDDDDAEPDPPEASRVPARSDFATEHWPIV